MKNSKFLILIAAISSNIFLFSCSKNCKHLKTETVQKDYVAASCSSAGSYKEVVCCSDCGEILSEVEHTIDKIEHTEVIDKKIEPTFTTTGLTEGSHCSVCGEIIIPQQEIPMLIYSDYAYTCTFIPEENVEIYVFPSKDYSVNPSKGNIAYSVGDNGEFLKDGEGQINFELRFKDGFVLDTINITGKYKNLKGPEDTGRENTYRVTKINSELTISVTSKEKTLSPVQFENDSGVKVVNRSYNAENLTETFSLDFKKYYIVDSIEVTSEDGAILTEIEKNKYQITNITPSTKISIFSVCGFIDTEVAVSVENNNLILHWQDPTNRYSKLTTTIKYNGKSTTVDLTDLNNNGNKIYNFGQLENVSYKVTFKATTKGGKTIETFNKLYAFPTGDIEKIEMPSIEIETKNSIFPYNHNLSAPEGQLGATIIDNDYVQSKIVLRDSMKNVVYTSSDSESEDKYDSAKIKIRGNTSARLTKKPMKIKLNKAADLLSELIPSRKDSSINFKNKEWVLLRESDLKQVAGSSVSSTVELEYAPESYFINLIINGAYKGVYQLTEAVTRGNGSGEKQSRLKISDTGFIIENDAYWWKEDLYFKSPIDNTYNHERWTFTFPDPDDLTSSSEEFEYIKKYVINYENLLMNGDEKVFDFIDKDSYVKWCVGRMIIASADPAGTNMYACKKDNTDESKIYAGVMWDFNTSFNYSDPESEDKIFHVASYYPSFLMKIKSFKDETDNYLRSVSNKFVTDFTNKLSRFDTIDLDSSIKLNNLCWGESSKNYSTQKTEMVTWLTDHINWLLRN